MNWLDLETDDKGAQGGQIETGRNSHAPESKEGGREIVVIVVVESFCKYLLLLCSL